MSWLSKMVVASGALLCECQGLISIFARILPGFSSYRHTSSRGCGNCGNCGKPRNGTEWNGGFSTVSIVSTALVAIVVIVPSTERETDCYTWHNSTGCHTLVDAALCRAITESLGS